MIESLSMDDESDSMLHASNQVTDEFIEQVTPIINLVKRVIALISNCETQTANSVILQILQKTQISNVLGELIVLLYPTVS